MDEQEDTWVDDFLSSPYVPKAKPARRTTPHAALKHRCRNALTAWRQAHGVSVVLLPSIVGKIKTMQGKEIAVGKKGQADDTIILGKDGVLWAVIAAEYKAGHDHQSEVQKRFEEKCTPAGITYVICRKPQDLTDALTQILAGRGELF
jgi:hypothetical protein